MSTVTHRQIPSHVPNQYQSEQIARKFGMFLHFGVNTFGNVEWSNGGIPALSYRPDAIHAEQWVRTAWEAGMNYVILITKHHDGFCLWDTDTTEYSVRHSGNHTDVVKAVSDACRKYGIKLGLYYSLLDRKEPTYTNDFENGYIPYMKKQLTELMDGRYGEIVELWLDGPWDKPRSAWKLEELYSLVKSLQPKCQIGINHTIGVDNDLPGFPGEYYAPEKYREKDPVRMYPSDFRLWDPHCCRADDPKIYTYGGNEYYMPFEMTICSREGFSWFNSNIYEQKPLLDIEDTVEKCRTCMEADNMVVINMPPNVHGLLSENDVEHLLEISRRLGIARIPLNGEADADHRH